MKNLILTREDLLPYYSKQPADKLDLLMFSAKLIQDIEEAESVIFIETRILKSRY